MMYYMNLISIVIAVSLDGFGVGVSYGMRKIRMSFTPIMIIMICSGSIVVMSMTIGNFLRQFIPPEMTHIVGSILLIIIGGFVLISIIRMRLKDEEPPKQKSNSNRFTHFKSILSTPQAADRDKSGTISVGEAL